MKTNKYVNRAKILNPLILIIYGVACYYLIELARYGGVKRRVPIILFIFTLLIIWFIHSFYRTRKPNDASKVDSKNTKSLNQEYKVSLISKWWFRIAVIVILLITGFTSYDIYQSSIPYNGKLSWYIHEIQTKKEVVYTHNNIYEDGLAGLIEDMNKKIELPEDLYIANDVTLSFTKAGRIIDFYGFLYGKNKKGETETFLLSYDGNQKIQVSLDNYLEETYEKDKLLQPLIDGLEYAPFKEMINDLNAEVF